MRRGAAPLRRAVLTKILTSTHTTACGKLAALPAPGDLYASSIWFWAFD